MTVTTETWTTNEALRLRAIEEALTAIWQMMENVISKEQFNRLNVVRQKQIDNIETRLVTLTANVVNLQSQIASLL